MEFIGPGDYVELGVQSVSSLESDKYKTRVVKVLEDDLVAFELIKRNDFVAKLAVNIEYTFVVFTRNGVYKYIGTLLEYKRISVGNESSVCAIVRVKDKGEKQQRRSAFRFDCNLPMRFNVLGEESYFDALKTQEGLIVDISAGGIKFHSNCELKSQDIIDIEVVFSEEMHFLQAEIKNVYLIEARNYKYQYRARFNDLPSAEEDKIIQYVLNAQRKLIKKRNFGE